MSTIRLDAATQAFVDEQVETGAYPDSASLMREALALLRLRDAKLARLRGMLQEGIDDIESGRVHRYETPENLLKDIQQMAAAEAPNKRRDH